MTIWKIARFGKCPALWVLAAVLMRAPVASDTFAAAAQDRAAAVAAKTSIAEPTYDRETGVWRYRITCPYQQGANDVEVLLPDDYSRRAKYRSLYVLPVETGIGGRYGDGLRVIKNLDAHNRYQLICIAPAFDSTPWYMDHATNPHRQHETYIKQTLVPLMEERYSIKPPPAGRLLLGFSKSGWGAFTLLLRDPEFFGYAASWDAPLMLEESDWQNWGIAGAAGTIENFRAYQPARLFPSKAELFGDRPRFVLLGHKLFGSMGGPRYRGDRTHTRWAHDRMTSWGLRHVYDNEIHVAHEWRSEWVEPAIRHLATISEEDR